MNTTKKPNRLRAYASDRAACRTINDEDYELLLAAASSVVINNRQKYRSGSPEYILVRFAHWVSFPESFPKGYVVEKGAKTNTYKINARKLIDYMHSIGKSPYTASQLAIETVAFEKLKNSVEQMFEDGL